MARTIQLSDATYRRLLRQALSFGDTPEDVINRLLEVVGDGDPLRREEIRKVIRETKESPRSATGSLLPEREYWKPILRSIVEAGGSATASDVIDAVGEQLKDSLTPRDFDRLEMGEIRWRNRARFARLRMTELGLLSSPHRGTWGITDSGRAYLEEN